MKRFTHLFRELDETNRTNEKVAALERYFREAPPRDAAWALHFLCGRRPLRAVTTPALRDWAAEEAQLAPWLFDECHQAVGDLAEAIALVLPEGPSSLVLPLHEVVEQRLLPLQAATETKKKELLIQTWRELDTRERLVWNKLITGNFRVGVAQTLVVRALASVSGVEPPILAHRLMGAWKPTPDDFERLRSGVETGSQQASRPYPFFLATQLMEDPGELGPVGDWQAEWKWDGIRAQVIHRQGEVVVWSRGDELVTPTFPEIAEVGSALPEGTVLDGEIVAWAAGRPALFGRLQRRLGRKEVSAKLRSQFPVLYVAYDLLEWNGEDWRERPLTERRQQLEAVVGQVLQRLPASWGKTLGDSWETPDLFEKPSEKPEAFVPLQLSESLRPTSWDELSQWRRESRERGVEGIMLKRHSSVYGVGRQIGDWWKWKIDPLVIDAVLLSAELGHGRRASLYTDYTFGLWQGDQLAPIAKAYSGLTDEEILEVDAFVRANTINRFGPLRAVKPELVFELAFESVQESKRHKAGLAVRFPRMNRWRRDKKPAEADSLETLRAFLRKG